MRSVLGDSFVDAPNESQLIRSNSQRALSLVPGLHSGMQFRGTWDRPLAKGWAISENPVFGTWLMRIEAGLLLTYAKVTGPGARF